METVSERKIEFGRGATSKDALQRRVGTPTEIKREKGSYSFGELGSESQSQKKS